MNRTSTGAYLKEKTLPRSGRKGFTLLEVMISMTLSTMVAGAIFMVLTFVGKSTFGLTNYSDMSGNTRTGMEVVGRDFRAARDIVTFANDGSQLTLYLQKESFLPHRLITYRYDPQTRTVTRRIDRLNDNRTQVVSTVTTTLIRDVDSFEMVGYNLNRHKTSNPPEIKQVQMRVRLLRNLSGIQNTEEIYSARFILRNKG